MKQEDKGVARAPMRKSRLFSRFNRRFLLLIALPFLLVSSAIMIAGQRALLERNTRLSDLVTSQVSDSLEKSLDKARDIALDIMLSERILSFFSLPYREGTDLPFYCDHVIGYLKSRAGLMGSLHIRLYLENDTLPGFEMLYDIRELEDPDVLAWYRVPDAAPTWFDGRKLDSGMFLPSRQRMATFYGYTVQLSYGGEQLGLCTVGLPYEELVSLGRDSDSQVALDLEHGRLYFNASSTEMTLEALRGAAAGAGGVPRGVLVQSLQRDGWPFELTTLTRGEGGDWLFILFTLSLLMVLMLVLLFYRYNAGVIHNVQGYLGQLNLSVAARFSSRVRANPADELTELADGMNQVLDQAQNLLSASVAQSNLASRAQLIALQQQINPHFIYNTMETFSSKMEKNGLYDESAAMAAFCRILRYSIDNHSLLVPLGEEMRQCSHYARIPRLMGVDLQLDWDIPDALLEVPVIRFILQPFVENSVKYRRGDAVHCLIRARREGEGLLVTVSDDGKGMPEMDIRLLNARFSKEEKRLPEDTHIGLGNINRRLRLFYGPGARIHAGLDGAGRLTFHFRIPLDTDQDHSLTGEDAYG